MKNGTMGYVQNVAANIGFLVKVTSGVFIILVKTAGILSEQEILKSEVNIMLQKNIDKEKRKERKLWTGFFTRRTPTKKEKEEKNIKIPKFPLDKSNKV